MNCCLLKLQSFSMCDFLLLPLYCFKKIILWSSFHCFIFWLVLSYNFCGGVILNHTNNSINCCYLPSDRISIYHIFSTKMLQGLIRNHNIYINGLYVSVYHNSCRVLPHLGVYLFPHTVCSFTNKFIHESALLKRLS